MAFRWQRVAHSTEYRYQMPFTHCSILIKIREELWATTTGKDALNFRYVKVYLKYWQSLIWNRIALLTQVLWMLLRLFKIHVVIRFAMDKVHTMLYLFDCWYPMQKEFPPTFDRQNMIWERWAHDIWVCPKNTVQSNHTFHYFGSLRGFLSIQKISEANRTLLHIKLNKNPPSNIFNIYNAHQCGTVFSLHDQVIAWLRSSARMIPMWNQCSIRTFSALQMMAFWIEQ